MITQKHLKSILYYSETDGNFFWKIKKSLRINIGDVAGKVSKNGYIVIKIDGKEYKAHRLAWLYVYGLFPEKQIDHINGVRSDNRIKNIREASQSQNLLNTKKRVDNTTGYKNVYFNKHTKTWYIKCQIDGKRNTFGMFKTKEFAWDIYKNIARQFHGEFLNVQL
jgi:hypothetical protein